jgi:hypothetical protein
VINIETSGRCLIVENVAIDEMLQMICEYNQKNRAFDRAKLIRIVARNVYYLLFPIQHRKLSNVGFDFWAQSLSDPSAPGSSRAFTAVTKIAVLISVMQQASGHHRRRQP